MIELTDSLKTIYYNDAAYIEYLDLTMDCMAAEHQVKLSEENIENYLDVSSAEPLNIRALSNEFISTGEFIYFEPNVIIGLSTSIVYKEENNFKKYTFSLGWRLSIGLYLQTLLGINY